MVTALSGSGLPSDAFYFGGFLPVKSGRRARELGEALARRETSIFFESPHRLAGTLAMLRDLDPVREVCVARELTKKFETYHRGTVADLLEEFTARPPKGEITLLIRGAGGSEAPAGGLGENRTGRGLETRPGVFISSPMSLRDKFFLTKRSPCRGSRFKTTPGRRRDRSLAPVRHRLTLVAPLLRRPDRFGPTAFVVALLQEKSRVFPDSVLREPGFQRVSGEGKRILPPVSRVLPSVFKPCPRDSPFSRASWFRKSRFSGVSETRLDGMRDSANRPEAAGGVVLGRLYYKNHN